MLLGYFIEWINERGIKVCYFFKLIVLNLVMKN